MDGLWSAHLWGTPVGLGLFIFLMGIGIGVFFWGVSKVMTAQVPDKVLRKE